MKKTTFAILAAAGALFLASCADFKLGDLSFRYMDPETGVGGEAHYSPKGGLSGGLIVEPTK